MDADGGEKGGLEYRMGVCNDDKFQYLHFQGKFCIVIARNVAQTLQDLAPSHPVRRSPPSPSLHKI
jgi:hypothetical protein